MEQILTGSPGLAYSSDGAVAYVVSGQMYTRDLVQEYNFGYVTSTAGSLLFGSTTHPLNGEILRIVYSAANFTTGGSIWLQQNTNGVVENIGSVAANLNANSVVYPAKALQNGTGASKVPINGYLYFSGIGVGGPLSGQLSVFYR